LNKWVKTLSYPSPTERRGNGTPGIQLPKHQVLFFWLLRLPFPNNTHPPGKTCIFSIS
jgi:hypothetical protein